MQGLYDVVGFVDSEIFIFQPFEELIRVYYLL